MNLSYDFCGLQTAVGFVPGKGPFSFWKKHQKNVPGKGLGKRLRMTCTLQSFSLLHSAPNSEKQHRFSQNGLYKGVLATRGARVAQTTSI